MAAQPIQIPRTCSQCGHNGHNTRTCPEPTTTTNTANDGVMLFGVRLLPMSNNNSPSPNSPISSSSSSTVFKRKCMSMNNLVQYEQQQIPSYGSDDDSGNRNRERKRGTPWTEEEHRQFLMGLNEVGKGDWRGISRNFLKTRTPTQVASHAQKYFLRKTNLNRKRRRSSLFDITADTMSRSASTGQLVDLDRPSQPNEATIQQPRLFSTKLLPIPLNTSHTTTHTIASPPSQKTTHLNLNQLPKSSAISSPSSSSISTNDTFISLKLSQSPSDDESSRPGLSNSFGGFNENSDSIISVA